MLNQVEARDIPALSSGKPASPMRAFADEAAREFMEAYAVGESAELTGWPADAGRSAEWSAAKARRAVVDALWRMRRGCGRDLRREVEVTRRGERVFMTRLERR